MSDVAASKSKKLGVETEEEATNDIEHWRKTRHEKCKDPTGWLTLVGLHWLRKGENKIGLAEVEDNSIKFASESCPPHLGTITFGDNESLSFTPAPGVKINSAGQHVTQPIALRSDVPDDNPTQLTCGSLTWFVIKRGQRFGIRVKDSKNEVLANFKGISNFPINLSLRLVANFVPHETGPKPIKILNALEEYEDDVSHGNLEFSVRGQLLTLMVSGDIKKPCMLVFGDLTSGKETYAGGRFLWVDPPNAEGKTLLDFNKSYNPPCVFTPWATCPKALPQNRLQVRIEAGEKMYGNQH